MRIRLFTCVFAMVTIGILFVFNFEERVVTIGKTEAGRVYLREVEYGWPMTALFCSRVGHRVANEAGFESGDPGFIIKPGDTKSVRVSIWRWSGVLVDFFVGLCITLLMSFYFERAMSARYKNFACPVQKRRCEQSSKIDSLTIIEK